MRRRAAEYIPNQETQNMEKVIIYGSMRFPAYLYVQKFIRRKERT